MSNKSSHVHVMDIPFLNKTKELFLKEDLYPRLLQNKKTFIVTANPEIVMATREDKHYKAVVQSANYIVPDGIGIIYAAKRQNTPLDERIAGYDLMIDLLKHANENRLSCYLLGATAETNEKAVKKVNEQYPHVRVVGSHHGYFEDETPIIDDIQTREPDLVFVALGFPKQEYFISDHFDDFKKGVFIGVGGSFDVLAGNTKRAPSIWIKLNLEWLYRFIKQPSRIGRLFQLFKFMAFTIFKR